MSTIKAGYRLTVKSWENDGDARQTIVVDGLSCPEVYWAVAILSILKSKNNHQAGKKYFGNMYEPRDKEREEYDDELVRIFKENHHGYAASKYWSNGEPSDLTDEDIAEISREFVSDFMGYSEFYTRVMDSFKVEYIPEAIEIQDVTEQFLQK